MDKKTIEVAMDGAMVAASGGSANNRRSDI